MVRSRRVSVEELSRSDWPVDVPVKLALVVRQRKTLLWEVPFPRQAFLCSLRENKATSCQETVTYILFSLDCGFDVG